MSRPSDNITKAIACRVPMPEYIRILTEASNRGIGVSEWLLMKIYVSDEEKGLQRVPSKAVEAQSKKEVQALVSEKEKYRITAEDLKRERDDLFEEASYFGEKTRIFQEENEKLNAENEKLKAEIEKMKHNMASASGQIEFGDPHMSHEQIVRIVRKFLKH